MNVRQPSNSFHFIRIKMLPQLASVSVAFFKLTCKTTALPFAGVWKLVGRVGFEPTLPRLKGECFDRSKLPTCKKSS